MNIFKNFSLPNEKEQVKILWAIGYSFTAAFIVALTAQGGFQVGIGWEGTMSLLAGCAVAGVNAVLYTLKIMFFDKPE